MTVIKILCISDLHYSKNDGPGVYTDKKNIKLRKDISKHDLDILYSSLEDIGSIDLMVFCGDIIVGGDTDCKKKESLEDVKNFINKIVNSNFIFNRKNNESNWEHIIYVPGNHDTDRSNQGEVLDSLSFLSEKALSPSTNDFHKYPFAPTFIFDEQKLIVSLISTAENSFSENGNIKEVLEIIKSLPEKFKEQKEKIDLHLRNYAIYDIPSITSETTKKFIFTNREITKNEKYNSYKRIMISHHPLLSGTFVDNSLKMFSNTVGGYGFLKSAQEYGYSLFVHGHVHELSCIEVTDQTADVNETIIQLGLPQMLVDKESSGCVLIEIDDQNERFPLNFVLLSPNSLTYKFNQKPIINYKMSNYKERKDHILVDYEISDIIKENKIIKNGDLRNIEAASYDCSLGYEYKKGASRFCDWGNIEATHIVPENNQPGYIKLEPNETILIFSHEEFNIPDNMVLHASPISSWLRKGIKFDISFFVDPGFCGKFSIPVTNESDKPIIINAEDTIVSLELIQLSASCEKDWSKKHSELAQKRSKLIE